MDQVIAWLNYIEVVKHFNLDLPPTSVIKNAFFNINTPSDLINLSKSKQPKQIG
jgi:molybdopterin-guanine dinucleotide biosynthesis protein A